MTGNLLSETGRVETFNSTWLQVCRYDVVSRPDQSARPDAIGSFPSENGQDSGQLVVRWAGADYPYEWEFRDAESLIRLVDCLAGPANATQCLKAVTRETAVRRT
ncbi:unnamed protein product [Protopolystoma xenopodis]|uniref:Uncharacterized protein n=1 Tax=Protopolystoma xenopodis TaxID=117903 RepID=A0A3S5FH09_9PLAT|nr:unnamed protein product [Protopolystoma xenopodis]